MEEYKRCEKCGTVNKAADTAVPCKECGAILAATVPESEAPAQSSAIDSPDVPNTTEGKVEAIGAYGMAADAAWVDPSKPQEEAVELEVPEEVLERHKAEQACRNNTIGIVVAAVGALFLMVMLKTCGPLS